MRVFLDANILYSAALPGSRMPAFLELLQRVGVCVTSTYAYDEARRNLSRKTPDAQKKLEELAKSLTLTGLVANVAGIELKDKDRPILGAAIAAQCSRLLTGDERDFGCLFGKTVFAVKVTTAKMLADELTAIGALKK
jgi:uncharacterized protein